MKKIIVLLLIICLTLSALSGCSADNVDDTTDARAVMPAVTNMAGSQTSAEVCDDLNAAGLSNVVTFNDWVLDFAGSAGDGAKLSDKWMQPGANTPDLAACADGWEKQHDFSDADCRMTAMLLLDGIITAEKTDSDYTGTYLMFDVDAIESADRYEVIRKNLDLFTTLFGDRTPGENEDPSEVFGNIWSEYGFSISNENVSLVSIVVYDPDFNQTFTGHTGILVKLAGDIYLFVEKLAFEQPYQATLVSDTDQLFSLLANRNEYYGGEGDPGPYVYLNGDCLGELKTWQ
ncbi:MAG: DUF4300 family protein [Mogibacterium sp.]|nr:DUF4300 family protein [Mogibacterium sp.]